MGQADTTRQTEHPGDVAALERLAGRLRDAPGPVVALTGAGVSVASGVPDFRSDAGLWQRYDPLADASISALRAHPERVWALLWELDAIIASAEPNPAHRALAALEEGGALAALLTQNPDGLHQRAGSDEVVELHGTAETLSCLACGRRLSRAEVTAAPPSVPRCSCGGVVRPDVTLFGEALPPTALAAGERWCDHAAVLLVIGTSVEVSPVADLPDRARRSGAEVWELNVRPAERLQPDQRLLGRAEEVLPALAERVVGRTAPRSA